MSENFGCAVDFILRLQSINLLVRVTLQPQCQFSVNSIKHVIIADFSKKKWSGRIKHKS